MHAQKRREMMVPRSRRNLVACLSGTAIMCFGLMSIARSQQTGPGPDLLPPAFQHPVGDPAAGQNVFRYETFGNQGFWTGAMQLPQGIAAAKVTPLQALQLGLNVNVAALNPATVSALSTALQQVQSGTNPANTAFGDPNVTLSLIEQQAVMGIVVFDPTGAMKTPGNTGTLNVAGGDKVGLTCAVCHAITDNSVLAPSAALKTTGSVGKEIDGPANHGVDVGAIFATALRPLAYYPMLQLQYKAFGNATIGRGDFPGLLTTPSSIPTEQQAIQYLTGSGANGQRYYPVGQFDSFPDGIGAPTHNPPFFRTDLSAPWGVDGAVDLLNDFNNFVYTVSLDPTSVLTTAGKQFLHTLAGPAGDEIAADYQQVLQTIGVIPAGEATLSVVPFVQAASVPPTTDGAPVGLRVDATKLNNLNAYTNSLQSPAPGSFDVGMAALGQAVFAGSGHCTGCHQLDPNKFVPPLLLSMQDLYPGYNPTVIFVRPAPLSPIQKSFGGPSPFYDNRMVVVDATREGNIKGFGLPLKLDLARRTALLHDDEITGTTGTFDEVADIMMNPAKRDPRAAHPFFVPDPTERKAVIEFMKSLGTSPVTFTPQGVGNAASYMSGPVAPGELIAISATRLGITTSAASAQNTEVTFDNIPASLIGVTSTQLTAMVPYEIAGRSTTALKVTIAGQSAPVVTLNVALTAPGIFTLTGPVGNGDQAAVLNQDGTVNSKTNPAARGSAIAIFGTGEGETFPQASDGTITSQTNIPQPVAAASVTIDGQPAQVQYAGSAPGLVAGVLQVNAVVPAAANPGSVQISLNIGGVSSQSQTIIWLK
jgi:uncharacterized protein (TIGR03437 family)